MNYKKACELLGYTETNKELNAKRAKCRLSALVDKAPLRYKVACDVIIKA